MSEGASGSDLWRSRRQRSLSCVVCVFQLLLLVNSTRHTVGAGRGGLCPGPYALDGGCALAGRATYRGSRGGRLGRAGSSARHVGPAAPCWGRKVGENHPRQRPDPWETQVEIPQPATRTQNGRHNSSQGTSSTRARHAKQTLPSSGSTCIDPWSASTRPPHPSRNHPSAAVRKLWHDYSAWNQRFMIIQSWRHHSHGTR